MTLIHLRATVGADGNIVVPVGTDAAGQKVEVTVTPAHDAEMINGIPHDEWWARFRALAGSIDDPAFERPAQETYVPRGLD